MDSSLQPPILMRLSTETVSVNKVSLERRIKDGHTSTSPHHFLTSSLLSSLLFSPSVVGGQLPNGAQAI